MCGGDTTTHQYHLGDPTQNPPDGGDGGYAINGKVSLSNGKRGAEYRWELATLIDVMLLGHWVEMRSVGQVQGALRELAKLLPDEAERITQHGEIEKVSSVEVKTPFDYDIHIV